jgi:hypothetical protein
MLLADHCASLKNRLRIGLKRQVEVGNELLAISDILDPGFSVRRGRILRQRQLPVLQLAKVDLKSGKIKLPEFNGIIKEAIGNMKEAVKCVEDFEPFIVTSRNLNMVSNCFHLW